MIHPAKCLSSLRATLRSAAFLLLGLGAFFSQSAEADPCPASDLQFLEGPPFQSTAAALDTSLSERNRLAFDLRAGTLGLRLDGTELCCQPSTHLRVRDRFDLVGVPPGTSVPVVVELTMDGEVSTPGCGGSGCWGDLTAAIISGAASDWQWAPVNIFGAPPRAVHRVARLPIVFVAGQPVVIEFLLGGYQSAGGGHLLLADGTIHFDWLPPGAAVVSCQGFGAQPTTVTASSWGGLKVRYR